MRYVLVTLAVLGLLALVFPYTGIYNVAATAGHTDFARWYLDTTSERSIRARADGVRADAAPVDLADSARVARGAVAYAGMCRVCHGAPGRDRGVIGQGLTPPPPRLSEEAAEWGPGEVHWILAHGIKMAGMPAFGPTHSDEELWEIVAFVERLPGMTPEEYEALTATSTAGGAPASGGDGHDHTH